MLPQCGGMAGIGEVSELLRRSTVHIRTSHSGAASAGSGIIVNTAGTVITNAHVAAAEPLQVELWDGRSFVANLIERDPRLDLAKLRLSAGDIQMVKLRAAPVRAGEKVIAVGNPLGFTGAISTGVIHAEGRIRGLGAKRWVQAAVRLAPGNSGGPLADMAGEVVGINTMVVSGGMALAIPSSVVEQFLRYGSGPRLGVTIRPVRLQSGRFGLLVLGIEPGGAAERASFLPGDIILGTAQREFAEVDDLGDALAAANTSHLRLRFLRGDHKREREVAVSLGGPTSAAA